MSLKTWNPNLMCYTGKWRLLRTAPDHLSWGNKKAKRFLELEVHPRKDLGKRLNLPGSITISVRGVLAFEETPGTGAGKVPMHAPLGPPPVWVVRGPSPWGVRWRVTALQPGWDWGSRTCPAGQNSRYRPLGASTLPSVASLTNEMQDSLPVLSVVEGDAQKWSTANHSPNLTLKETSCFPNNVITSV